MSYRPDPGWDDHAVDPDYGGTRWRGHLYKALISVGVLAAFGAAVLYAYSEGAPGGDVRSKPGGVPLVKAEATPVKVRPADPGGVKVPHRDRDLYRRIDPDERNADKREARAEKRAARVPPRPQTYEDILAPKHRAKPKPKAPSAVKRVEVRPVPPKRGAETQPPDRAEARRAPDGGRIAMKPSLRGRDTAGAPRAKRPGDRQVAELSPRAGTQVKPKARPRDSVQTASLIGPYRVQLGAFRSPAKAQYEWRSLVRSNKDVLGSLSMVIERVNLGPKGIYYRLQAGPLKTAPAARGICRKLGKRKVDCILVNG